MLKQKTKVVLILSCIMMLSMSCSLPFLPKPTVEETLTPTEPPIATELPMDTETAEPVTVDASAVYPAKFSEYQQMVVTLPAEFSGGYSLPIDLGQVDNLDEYTLSPAQRTVLSANGFVVRAPSTDPNKVLTEFFQGYESLRYADKPVFVTTDSVFHVYHLVFDKMLRDLEKLYFIPGLKELTSTMIAATNAQYQQLQGGPLEDAAVRNAAFFSIAGTLLQTGDPVLPAAKPYVDAELALINAAAGVEYAPLWADPAISSDMQLIEDYSQYIPRGHYTRSADLEMYFRAMMWYGRMTYRLKVSSETQRALLLTQAMRTATSTQGNPALALWQNIYDPTVFIVGKADDLGVYEYGGISDEVFGENPPLEAFADEALMQTFLATARQLPPPQVNSMWVWIWQDQDDVTQGFRFMGQRFTLDQYVFGQMMWRKVGTLDNPRDLPKALDFFAAQGSDTALALLEGMGEADYLNFSTQMDKVRGEVSLLGLDSWTENLYWTWLYALKPLIAEKGAQYPAFMRTEAWARKDLQTALTSWTELKHDTILYSKQVMAEMGGGANDEVPHGYVEPNPEAYARLLALAEMTRAGLQSRSLLDADTQANLDNLIAELEFLLDIAQRELSGGTFSDDEYWQIQYYGGWLEAMTIASADKADEDSHRDFLDDQKSPVVADVATGMERVLEEGSGYPTYIYVVLPDQPYKLAAGVVYTYYEFVVSPEDRMTDETWRSLLVTADAPAQPDWTAMFIQP